MKRLGKKILGGLATLLAACGISVYFTACYGMPPNYYDEDDFIESPEADGDNSEEQDANLLSTSISE